MKTGSNSISLEKSIVTERGSSNKRENNYRYLQVRRNVGIIYSYSELCKSKEAEMQLRLKEARKSTYRGEMSETAKKNLRKRISIWFDAIEHQNKRNSQNVFSIPIRPVFLTVTLSASQAHSDILIKQRILKPFLRILRENYRCDRYIWKAERQQNGNVHFHILIDRYIDKEIVQRLWNTCQDSLYYVSEFQKKHGHRQPPSTQIEAIRDWNKMSAYIEKYVCKEVEGKKIEGAVWKCSKTLRTLSYIEIPVDNDLSNNILQAMRENSLRLVEKDHYTVLVPMKGSIEDIISKTHRNLFFEYRELLCAYLFDMSGEGSWSDYVKNRIKGFVPDNVHCKYQEIKVMPGVTQLTLFEDRVSPLGSVHRKGYM